MIDESLVQLGRMMNPLMSFFWKLRQLAILTKIAKNWYAPAIIRVFPFVDQSKQVLVKMKNGSCYIIRPKKAEMMVINDVLGHRIYTKYFPINGVTVDIGANIGVFSVCASKQAEQVIAFEPFPENYQVLKRNIELNAAENIKTFQIAIGSKNQSRLLSIDPKTSLDHTFYPKQDLSNTVVVKTITLEEVFTLNRLDRIDFLKMDCEGAELEIIENTPTELLTRIHKMVMECHRGNEQKIMEILTKSGFRVVYGDKSTLYACLREP
jgi:FkbM family methyltransferase